MAPLLRSLLHLFLLLVAGGFLLWLSWEPLSRLPGQWRDNEAYSHGWIIIAVALLLVWQRIPDMQQLSAGGSWWAVPWAVAALALLLLAVRAEIFVFGQYGAFAALLALVMATAGWQGLRLLALPLALIFLAIPLPGFLELSLTADLKLLSSRLGAWGLQQLGIPVYADGNIIDLGHYQLHVVDACSGLNYLVPLLAIGLIMAAFLRVSWWQRALVVLATIPITIAMNVLRILMTGILVRHFGTSAADGFVHDFEGWLVFVACLLMLLPVMALVVRLGPGPRRLRDALVVDLQLPRVSMSGSRPLPLPLLVFTGLLLGSLAIQLGWGERAEQRPERLAFHHFPDSLNGWQARHSVLVPEVIEALSLTDYLLAQYRSPTHPVPVELYVGYHGSQRQGAMPHSPTICLPGGGWETLHLSRTAVALPDGRRIPVNRALMQTGRDQMLVYYWFQQQGRLYANEYVMRLGFFRDSVLSDRTDGALIRLITPIPDTEVAADARLRDFMALLLQELPAYVPE